MMSLRTCSLTGRPPNRRGRTRFGRKERSSCIQIALANKTIRTTFTPPPVDPAQPPTNISARISPLQNSGHCTKSSVPKPVVVVIVSAVKTECRPASMKPYVLFFTSDAVSSTATPARMPQ